MMKAARLSIAFAAATSLAGCTFEALEVCGDGGTSNDDVSMILGLGCVLTVTTASLITLGVAAAIDAGDDSDPPDIADDRDDDDEPGDAHEAYWLDTCRDAMTGGADEKARMGWLHAGYRPAGDEADAYLWFELALADDPTNANAASGLVKIEPQLAEADRARADRLIESWRFDPGRCEALYLAHRTRIAGETDAVADAHESWPEPAAPAASDGVRMSCYGWRTRYDCRM